MKLVSYIKNNKEQLGFVRNGMVCDLNAIAPEIPATMDAFLKGWDDFFALAKAAISLVDDVPGTPVREVRLLAPVPHPPSCRDGYAFRRHVETARRNRRLPMIPEFDQYPVFYFGNPASVMGPGPVSCMPDHFKKLDFELEAAIVICRKGRNIRAEEADAYIAGLMIMNDLSARTFQMEEMMLNLGPAKGKDFATATGPWLVTPDELKEFECACKAGHTGKAWDLGMRCTVNGQLLSEGKLSAMEWTFAELIERASYGADLHPGDIIGSGTVGSGCLLELNGSGRIADPLYKEQWLTEGDIIQMEIDGLGQLLNQIVKEEDDFSILDKKKINHSTEKKQDQ